MTASEWMSLLACGGILALALVVLRHATRNPLALPLGLWSVDLFIWNFATLAYALSGSRSWHYLDVTFSPFTPPLALHIVLVFVGKLRPLRGVLVLAYLAFTLLSLSSAAAFLWRPAGAWIESSEWSLVYLIAWAPLIVLALTLLVRHLRSTEDLDEQLRTRLIIAAQAVGGLLGSTEMWNDLLAFPGLGHLGSLGASGLLAMVVLRFRLLGRSLSAGVAAYALTVAALGVFGYLALFKWLGSKPALLVLGVAGLTLALLAVAWDVVAAVVRWLERMRGLAEKGRLSAQLAHDVRNPLAALKGSLQYLDEEAARGRLAAEHREFVELAGAQVRRIEEVVENYVRLGAEPRLRPTAVNEVVRGVLAASAIAALPGRERVELRAELAEELPPCTADPELLAVVLENLVRNSVEAMPAGGVLTVRTGRAADGGVSIAVEDTGQGMDARQLAQAFDYLYTTKATGSGLGLPFVRRVIERHGGDVRATSVLGKGTVMSLRLRATAAAASQQEG